MLGKDYFSAKASKDQILKFVNSNTAATNQDLS